MSALELAGLAVSFGSVEVLADVDLVVAEQGFTAVLGASGSGKTTLLRIIAGFQRPNRGAVTLAGRVVDGPGIHVVPERRGLGYVAQEGALFPHLDVDHNVGFGLRRVRADGRSTRFSRSSGASDASGTRAARKQRVGELLELVGLSGLGRRYPHELSGGQQQRVALARALALRPSVVLLDEPFSSLDAALRAAVRADIAAVLRSSGAAVVLVTHDQQEALSMADQVAVLRAGRVAQVGSPREIYTHPVDAEMAGFLGDANLVDAELGWGFAVTALGRLGGSGLAASGGRGVALIRPEQIEISVGLASSGLSGTVLEHVYHGHDSLVTVVPDRPCGSGDIRVRVQGSRRFVPGEAVTLTARGDVVVWSTP